MPIDLWSASFDEILAFVFDHEAAPGGDLDRAWWWAETYDEDPRTDPRRQVEFLRRLPEEARLLLERFGGAQIDQGFWFMFGPGGEAIFRNHLWNAAVPWLERRAAILGLSRLYPDVFAHTEMGEVPFMLWDFLAFGYDAGTRDPHADVEDRRVQDAIFEALSGLLDSADADAQRAALHGLGHLQHPGGHARVQRFLTGPAWIEPDVRAYAENVLAGSIL